MQSKWGCHTTLGSTRDNVDNGKALQPMGLKQVARIKKYVVAEVCRRNYSAVVHLDVGVGISGLACLACWQASPASPWLGCLAGLYLSGLAGWLACEAWLAGSPVGPAWLAGPAGWHA